MGTSVFIPAIICLLLALQWGGTKYHWGNVRIIVLFVLFGIFIGSFIAIQFWQGDSATVPLSIIKKRSMWSASWFSFCLGSYFFLLIYFLPVWFQAVKGDSAVKSGISIMPMLLSLVIVRSVSFLFTITCWYTNNNSQCHRWYWCHNNRLLRAIYDCFISTRIHRNWYPNHLQTRYKPLRLDWLSMSRRYRHRSRYATSPRRHSNSPRYLPDPNWYLDYRLCSDNRRCPFRVDRSKCFHE